MKVNVDVRKRLICNTGNTGYESCHRIQCVFKMAKRLRFTSNSPSPITGDEDEMIDRYTVKTRERSISSTPISRAKCGRESLGSIKQNTVSGMINKFNHQKKATHPSVDDKNETSARYDKSSVRQISFFNDLSSITSHASENGIDSKINSMDSGYDSSTFRRRSLSVNATALNNQSRSIVAQYEKYPNFNWNQLKYFGVDPQEYLLKFNIDLNTIHGNSSDQKANRGDNEGIGTSNDKFNILRKRSQSFNVERVFNCNTTVNDQEDSSFKVSYLKYFGLDSSEQDNLELKSGEPQKVATAVDVTSLEDTSSMKAAASREAYLKNSLQILHKKTMNEGLIAETPELNLKSVDTDVVSLDGKMLQEPKLKQPKPIDPIKDVHKTGIDSDLKSRIQKSIKSYDNMIKTAFRKGGVRWKKRTGVEANEAKGKMETEF